MCILGIYCYNKFNMELNNPQHKSFLCTSTSSHSPGTPSPPFVTEENKEAWRYIKERAGQSPNHRGMKKKLMDLMPKTPFEGEPMAVTREPNDMEKSLL